MKEVAPLQSHRVVWLPRSPTMSPSASPSDEQLMAAYYQCDAGALDRLAERHHALLARFVYLMLVARTGNSAQALGEWDLDERVQNVWAVVMLSKMGNTGRRPQNVSVLVWLVSLVCREVDRHLGYR